MSFILPPQKRTSTMLTGDELLEKVKEMCGEKTETTITKEQLDKLWNALEYTLDCFSINKGRAYQSYEYLKKSIDIVNQLKKELQ
jgi:hypothetical protein